MVDNKRSLSRELSKLPVEHASKPQDVRTDNGPFIPSSTYQPSGISLADWHAAFRSYVVGAQATSEGQWLLGVLGLVIGPGLSRRCFLREYLAITIGG